MAINLIDLAKGYLTESVINSVSGAIGESAVATRQAAGGAIPAVLGGIISKASSADGAGMLASMLDRDHDGRVLDDLAGMVGGGQLNRLIDFGSGALGSIFSSGLDSIASAISGASGIGAKSSSSLLKILAPIVLGVLGKQKRSMGLDAAGLAKMLMGQADLVKQALPAGLSNTLGLADLGGTARDGAAAAAGVAQQSGAVVASTGGAMLRKLLPVALLAGAVILLWPTMRGCGQQATNSMGEVTGAAGDAMAAAGTATTDMADEVGETAGNAMDEVGQTADEAVDQGASMFDYSNAPGTVDLGVETGGVVEQFVAFLKSAEGMERTFTLDKVNFETGWNVLTPGSRGQLSDVAKVLNAYSSIRVELQGHTDSQGNDNSNQALSELRANAVKIFLESKGISPERMTAVGYGEAEPVATNDTEAGRARNRRTDIRVTQK